MHLTQAIALASAWWGGPGDRPRARAPALLCGGDFQEFDFENQGGAAGDGRAALIAVGQIAGADQGGFAADLHALHAFGPALDDAVQGELRGLIALVGAIEFGAVD